MAIAIAVIAFFVSSVIMAACALVPLVAEYRAEVRSKTATPGNVRQFKWCQTCQRNVPVTVYRCDYYTDYHCGTCHESFDVFYNAFE